ncbi:hypothetical protein T492DRAFT_885845 [Pavlovales sp. CCMP2436]|nr:hypothetical protein T492DRAFT_885845 [Pavlovales sp. CCMP2436]
MLALVMGGLMVAALLPLTGSPASLALLAFSSAAAGAQLSADALYGPPNALDLAPVPACIAVAPPAPGWPTALYIGEQIEVLVECEPGVNLAIPACAGYIFEPAILSPAADSVGVTVYALVARAHIPTDADSRMSIIAGDGRAWPGVVVSLPAILALGEITVRFGSGRRVLYEDEALAVEFTLSHLPRDMLILTPHIRSGSESPAFRPRTLAFTPQSPLQGTVIIDLAVGTTHISVTCEGADAQHFSLEPKFLLSGLNVTVLPLESFTLSPRWATDIYVGETAVYSVTASVQPEAPITLTPSL